MLQIGRVATWLAWPATSNGNGNNSNKICIFYLVASKCVPSLGMPLMFVLANGCCRSLWWRHFAIYVLRAFLCSFSFFNLFFSGFCQSIAATEFSMWCQLNEMCSIECVALIFSVFRFLYSYFCAVVHSLIAPIKIDCDCVSFLLLLLFSLGTGMFAHTPNVTVYSNLLIYASENRNEVHLEDWQTETETRNKCINMIMMTDFRMHRRWPNDRLTWNVRFYEVLSDWNNEKDPKADTTITDPFLNGSHATAIIFNWTMKTKQETKTKTEIASSRQMCQRFSCIFHCKRVAKGVKGVKNDLHEIYEFLQNQKKKSREEFTYLMRCSFDIVVRWTHMRCAAWYTCVDRVQSVRFQLSAI